MKDEKWIEWLDGQIETIEKLYSLPQHKGDRRQYDWERDALERAKAGEFDIQQLEQRRQDIKELAKAGKLQPFKKGASLPVERDKKI